MIEYEVEFADGERVISAVDPTRVGLAHHETAPPDWTRLDFNQCDPCPIAAEEDARCPAAVTRTPSISLRRTSRSISDGPIVRGHRQLHPRRTRWVPGYPSALSASVGCTPSARAVGTAHASPHTSVINTR